MHFLSKEAKNYKDYDQQIDKLHKFDKKMDDYLSHSSKNVFDSDEDESFVSKPS